MIRKLGFHFLIKLYEMNIPRKCQKYCYIGETDRKWVTSQKRTSGQGVTHRTRPRMKEGVETLQEKNKGRIPFDNNMWNNSNHFSKTLLTFSQS